MRTLTAVIVCLPSVGVLVFGLSGDLLDGKLVESGPEHFLVDLYEAFFWGGGLVSSSDLQSRFCLGE